jgi:hypothetical protein
MRTITSRAVKAAGIAVITAAICGSVALGAEAAYAAPHTSAMVHVSDGTNTPTPTPTATDGTDNDPWD